MRKLPKPTRCIIKRRTDEENAKLYVVPEETVGEGKSPEVRVWWSREPRKHINGVTVVAEHMVVKQENGRVGADVLILTPGQGYDLIDALCKAMESL